MKRASIRAPWIVLCIGLSAIGCEADIGTRDVGERPPPVAVQASALTDVERAYACALLENDAVRARMSGALESKLLSQCDVQGTAGVAAARRAPVRAAGATAEMLAAAAAAAPSADILVNDPALDVDGTTQSETSVAVHGNVVCVAGTTPARALARMASAALDTRSTEA